MTSKANIEDNILQALLNMNGMLQGIINLFIDKDVAPIDVVHRYIAKGISRTISDYDQSTAAIRDQMLMKTIQLQIASIVNGFGGYDEFMKLMEDGSEDVED